MEKEVLPFDMRDMDIHALDMEDLNIDSKHDIAIPAPYNVSDFENFTIPTYDNTWIFGRNEDLIILPVLLSLIALCAFMSNGLIVFGVLGFKRMRTGPNLLILNLAFADLVFLMFCIPTSILNHAMPGNGALSEYLCKFVHYVVFVTVYTGIYTLVVLCVFRLCSELMSTKFTVLLSKTNAVITSMVIWAAFMTSHVNLLVHQDAALFQEPFICVHSDLLLAQTRMRTLWITFLTCAFLLPLVITCSLCALILHNNRSLLAVPEDSYDRQAAVEARQRRELTIMTMAAMVTKTICWLPIQVFIMIEVFGMSEINSVYRKAEMVGVCCAFIGSCINALIYNCISTEFRTAFRDVVKVLTCHKEEEPPRYKDTASDMNETIMSILTDSSNHINYT